MFPSRYARRVVRRVADQRPFPPERGLLGDRYLRERAGQLADALEVGEDHRLLRGAGQVRPAGGGGLVEALALEGPDQDWPLRAGTALVLYRLGHRRENRLVQDVDTLAGMEPAEPGEDRLLGIFAGTGNCLGHRSAQGQPAGAPAQDVGQQGAVGFPVTPSPARRTLRTRQAVTLLPVTQSGHRYPGSPGDFADRQHRRIAVVVPGVKATHDDYHHSVRVMYIST